MTVPVWIFLHLTRPNLVCWEYPGPPGHPTFYQLTLATLGWLWLLLASVLLHHLPRQCAKCICEEWYSCMDPEAYAVCVINPSMLWVACDWLDLRLSSCLPPCGVDFSVSLLIPSVKRSLKGSDRQSPFKLNGSHLRFLVDLCSTFSQGDVVTGRWFLSVSLGQLTSLVWSLLD